MFIIITVRSRLVAIMLRIMTSAAKACSELLDYLQKSDDPCPKCLTSVLNTLGNVYKKQNQWLKASEYYDRAYLLNSDNMYYDTGDRDIAREKVLQIQNRFPEIMFFVLLMIWCYSYSFDIFNVDQRIKQDILPLAFIRLIIYYLIQQLTIELTDSDQKKVERMNIFIDKILKKIRNTRLYQYKQNLLTYFYQFIPPTISKWTYPSFSFTERNRLNQSVVGFIFGIILLLSLSTNFFHNNHKNSNNLVYNCVAVGFRFCLLAYIDYFILLFLSAVTIYFIQFYVFTTVRIASYS